MSTQPLLYVGSVAGGHHKQIIQEATGTTVALVYDNDDTAEGIVKSINVAPKLAEALRACREQIETLMTWAQADMSPLTAICARENQSKADAALAEWDAS